MMFSKYISSKIIPVATIETEEELHYVAELALEFLPAIELTMRTPYSLKALEILSKEYPQLPKAAGTVFSVEQAEYILDLGTNIIVSPGTNQNLLQHSVNRSYTYIPGVATPSDIELSLSYNCRYLKFFPAALSGGIPWLKLMNSVYSHAEIKFMPLGGVLLTEMQDYLSQPNVFACGGSWMCSREILAEKNWTKLRKRFQDTHNLIKEIFYK